jgi:putative flippase GtrA
MTLTTFAKWLRHDLLRYFTASLVALAADLSTLSFCLRVLHFSLGWSASIGFTVGALVAYLLSIRWVFRQRAFADAPAVEFLAFVGIGIAGLGITQLLLWVGVVKLHLLPELVKLGAAVTTFAFNYLVRKTLLFAASAHARQSGEHDA